MKTTNYVNTFIAVALDTKASAGTAPPERDTPSVAERMFQMLHDAPYEHTSDEVIFTVFADRKGIAADERAAAREVFFSKGQPCLRASALAKTYGWGVHSDERGRVALYAVESKEYAAFVAGQLPDQDTVSVTVKHAMNSKRRRS